MLERFSVPARAVILKSQEEARSLNRSAVSTQELLLGLLGQSDGVAAGVLEEAGVSTGEVLQGMLSRPPNEVPEETASKGALPFTEEVTSVVAIVNQESHRRQDHYVGTGHLLLGLTREEATSAYDLLCGLGVDLERLGAEAAKRLGEHSEAPMDISKFEAYAERFPVLTRSKEIDLAKAVSAGLEARAALRAHDEELSPERKEELLRAREAGIQAAGRLIECNCRLVISLAKAYAREGHALPYAYQRASQALKMAVWSRWDFDWREGERFSSYAAARIKEELDHTLQGPAS